MRRFYGIAVIVIITDCLLIHDTNEKHLQQGYYL